MTKIGPTSSSSIGRGRSRYPNTVEEQKPVAFGVVREALDVERRERQAVAGPSPRQPAAIHGVGDRRGRRKPGGIGPQPTQVVASASSNGSTTTASPSGAAKIAVIGYGGYIDTWNWRYQLAYLAVFVAVAVLGAVLGWSWFVTGAVALVTTGTVLAVAWLRARGSRTNADQ
jgi:hypothetical protein